MFNLNCGRKQWSQFIAISTTFNSCLYTVAYRPKTLKITGAKGQEYVFNRPAELLMNCSVSAVQDRDGTS